MDMEDAEKTFEELLEEVEEQEGIGRSEGETGVRNLCRLVNILGYQDSQHFGQFAHNASYGDLIRFLEDNPGSIEALKDWICDHEQATDWREKLESELLETEKPDED